MWSVSQRSLRLRSFVASLPWHSQRRPASSRRKALRRGGWAGGPPGQV